ncbi:DUF4270 family protein [Spongiimicrobium salis]|uniref:DUF4270 family protein n=1 Tax=Spongiimicrobium salis TaxID=1667022 RepID=UPI00374D1D3B
MKFFRKSTLPAIAVFLLVTAFFSCEEELTTIGDGVIGEEPFNTDRESFNVFAYNKRINAVQTNRLLLYQLGFFNDPVYGRTEAQITSQLSLPASPGNVEPFFGNVTQATEDSGDNIEENERVLEVNLYIPFLTTNVDTDRDMVDDEFDVDPLDPNSDSDGDGVTDAIEAQNGTDPLNVDTDGDGLTDDVDDFTFGQRFPQRFAVDSVIGNRETARFRVNVGRSTFFLRDLDPSTNFVESQEFFSNQEFSPTFVSQSIVGPLDPEQEGIEQRATAFSDRQIQFIIAEDDEETEEDETGTIARTLPPGLRIPLDPAFFQENLLDMEGSQELLSPANFNDFLRGIHISITPLPGTNGEVEDLLFLVNLAEANIEVIYDHDVEDDNDTPDDASDDTIEKMERMYTINLVTQTPAQTGPIQGNAVNTFISEDYPAAINDQLDSGENASRIYLKGGAGAYAEIELFDETEEGRNTVIEQIRANNWIINEANLVFYVDREELDAGILANPLASTREPLRLFLFNAETNDVLYNAAIDPISTDSGLASFPQYDGVLETNSDDRGIRYTIRITNYLNEIILRGADNATLGLTVTSDIRIPVISNAMVSDGQEVTLPTLATVNPFGTVLFGSNIPEDDERRLKLEIFYTEAN